MALSKAFLVSVFLLILAAHLVECEEPKQAEAEAGGAHIDCAAKCEVRCSKNWKPKMCHKTCNTCCQRCGGCVPSGTGPETRSECPCYAEMKTHGDRYKCP